MKNLSWFLGGLVLLFCACADPPAEQAAPPTVTEETPEAAPPEEVVEIPGICLWDKAGLREAPGRAEEIKYLATINFGEKVIYAGENQEMPEEKRNYIKVRLSDGKEGWVNEYLFAMDARLAAATDEIELYHRPEMTTLKDQRFEAGEVVVLGERKDGWREVFGWEKKKQGWAKPRGLTVYGEKDIAMAIMLRRALSETEPLKKKEKLSSILSNKALMGSVFTNLVKEAIRGVDEVVRLPEDQMYIQANRVNIRSGPDAEADNIRFQLNIGDIVTIVEKGDREQIREMDDYWYKIDFQGQQGWVFGKYTSKRISP